MNAAVVSTYGGAAELQAQIVDLPHELEENEVLLGTNTSAAKQACVGVCVCVRKCESFDHLCEPRSGKAQERGSACRSSSSSSSSSSSNISISISISQ